MPTNIKETKTEDLMIEAKTLHDLIYNVECYTLTDTHRLDALYSELEHRVISVVEGYTVTFVEHLQSRN